MTKAANSVQEALRAFADRIGDRQIFDEASIALDAGCDYKLTITCTDKAGGYVVAMDRQQIERINHWSFTKLKHGEWNDAAGVQESGRG